MKIFAKIVISAFALSIFLTGCKSRNSAGDFYTEQQQNDDATLLQKLIADYSQKLKANITPEQVAEAKQKVKEVVIRLNKGKVGNNTKFYFVIRKLLDSSIVPAELGKVSAEKKDQIATQISDSVDAQLTMYGEDGRYPMPSDWRYSSWDADGRFKSNLVKEFFNKIPLVSMSGADPVQENQEFINQLQQIVGDDFSMASHAKLLVNGKNSFVEKYKLMENATESIWIASWAFGGEDDQTGQQAAKFLLKVAKEKKLDVRVIVDGQTANRQYGYWIDYMVKENEGRAANEKVKIVGWRHPLYPYFGVHRKFMIVDRKAMVIGGMNFGDEYSHKFNANTHDVDRPDNDKDAWRDTDLLLYGRVVDQAINIYRTAWNEAVTSLVPGLRDRKIDPVYDANLDQINPALKAIVVSDADLTMLGIERPQPAPVLILDNDPSKRPLDRIYQATLKMILGARKSIDISNAYYIATAPIEKALIAAIQRGVKVRIHTNSSESVDVGELVKPIYKGLGNIFKTNGVNPPEIYLQLTNTLHSKYMIVDGRVGWIGSYNLHPRSLRYEAETVAMFNGQNLAEEVKNQFLLDIDPAKARPLTNLKQLDVTSSPIADFSENFFFDQL